MSGLALNFFAAHLAAKFHFLILVDDALHLIPFVEGLIGDEADLKRIRFDDLFKNRSGWRGRARLCQTGW